MPTAPLLDLTPSVAPSTSGVAGPNLAVPVEAFGGAVGHALQGLGTDVETASDRIWQQAIAIKGLQNETAAKSADADYMTRSAAARADFLTRTGENAGGEALSAHIQTLQDLRGSIRDELPNDMARKLFDGSSQAFMGREIFAAAGHSAQQTKVAANAASQSRVSALMETVAARPSDDITFQRSLSAVDAEVRAQGRNSGWPQEQTDLTAKQTVSNLAATRIMGLAKTDIRGAQALLDFASAAGQVLPSDLGKILPAIQSQVRQVVPRMISHDISAGANNAYGQGPIDLRQAREAIGQIESGGDYGSQGVSTRHGTALGKYQVMSEFLPDFLAKAGLPSMTPAEYLASPKAQDAVFDANFGAYMKQTGSANDAASMWLTGKPLGAAGGVRDALGTDAKTYVAKFNSALASSAPLAQKLSIADAAVKAQAPNDPEMPDLVASRIEADHNIAMAAQRDDVNQTRMGLDQLLLKGLGGKPLTSVDQLISTPDGAALWDRLGKLDPERQRTYAKLFNENAKGDVPKTTDTEREFNRYAGMSETDPRSFLSTDVMGLPLPLGDRERLSTIQRAKVKSLDADPNVSKAMSILKPTLDSAGITTKDIEQRDQFVGALRGAMHSFLDANKRPPKDDEIQKMGSQLLQTQANTGIFTDYQTYNAPIPQDLLDKALTARPEWTKDDAQRAYTQGLYLQSIRPKAKPSGDRS